MSTCAIIIIKLKFSTALHMKFYASSIFHFSEKDMIENSLLECNLSNDILQKLNHGKWGVSELNSIKLDQESLTLTLVFESKTISSFTIPESFITKVFNIDDSANIVFNCRWEDLEFPWKKTVIKKFDNKLIYDNTIIQNVIFKNSNQQFFDCKWLIRSNLDEILIQKNMPEEIISYVIGSKSVDIVSI
jgi:hypothetical protein